MKQVIRHLMLIAVGLNCGLFALGTVLGAYELMIVSLLSTAACGFGYFINKEEE